MGVPPCLLKAARSRIMTYKGRHCERAMELFLHPMSPNCIAVLAVLAELELPAKKTVVDLFNDEQSSQAFRAINPNGLVPVLKTGGFILWETIPIMQFCASTAGDVGLWPRDDMKRADIARWQNWSAAHWTPALQPFIYENFFKGLKGEGQPNVERLQAAQGPLDRFAGILDAQLAKADWVVSDALTLADFSVAAYLSYMADAQLPLSGYPHIMEWFSRLTALASWQSAQAERRT